MGKNPGDTWRKFYSIENSEEPATNMIRRVKLEKQTLHYYDYNGHMLREKQL